MECKNCNKHIEVGYNYCPSCGQKSDIDRLNFRQLLNVLWTAFSNADRGILLLVKQLTYKPGLVSRDYVYGKRKLNFNPFNYLALMVAIAFYCILQFEKVSIDYSQIAPENIDLLRFSFKYFNIIILLTCPIYGVFIWLLFKNNQMNFAECLVLSAYISGHTMFYYIIVILIFILFPSFMNVMGVIFGFLINFWIVMAILQFYRTRSLWNIFKALLVVIIVQIISQILLLNTFQFIKH